MRKSLGKIFAEAPPGNGPARVYNAFDIIGDIAVTKIPSASTMSSRDVAGAIMNRHKNVKAVFVQETAVHGDFRLRGLTHVAGENRTCTVHKESGSSFMVNVEKCYFSPGLSGERLRIARLVQPGEIVVNMFAGVGCFSIIIAKHVNSARVFSIDVNPSAVDFMRENIRLNRVYGRVIPLRGDTKATIDGQLRGQADRVLMPLPEKALEYSPAAVAALKSSGGWMHIHVFEHAAKTENPAEKVKLKVAEALASLSIDFEVPLVRVVRKTGPNWFQVVADVHLSPLTQRLRP